MVSFNQLELLLYSLEGDVFPWHTTRAVLQGCGAEYLGSHACPCRLAVCCKVGGAALSAFRPQLPSGLSCVSITYVLFARVLKNMFFAQLGFLGTFVGIGTMLHWDLL